MHHARGVFLCSRPVTGYDFLACSRTDYNITIALTILMRTALDGGTFIRGVICRRKTATGKVDGCFASRDASYYYNNFRERVYTMKILPRLGMLLSGLLLGGQVFAEHSCTATPSNTGGTFFQVDVSVTNTGTTALSGWTVTLNFP
jgi:hypothetical protein